MFKSKSETLAILVLISGYLFLCFRGFISCWWYKLTGLKCAGCGGCHMVKAILEGDLRLAFHYNAFLFITIPLMLVLSFALRKHEKVLWITYTGLIIAWSIIRNIGGF